MKENQCGGTRRRKRRIRKSTRKSMRKSNKRWAYGGSKAPKAPNAEQKARMNNAKNNNSGKVKPVSQRQTEKFKKSVKNNAKNNAAAPIKATEAFSDYAGYHETDAGAPQATGAALRDVTIHPTNPVFSF